MADRPARLVGAGQRALAREDWARARALFAAAGDDPEALEGLAAAEWGDGDVAASVRALEGAYGAHRRNGDALAAGRVATALAIDGYVIGGDPVDVRGWLARARRLLQDHEDSSEFAWLRLWEGDFAMLVERDPATARGSAAEAARLARRCGDGDLEMLAVALEGLAQVSLGDVVAGMRMLDEVGAAAAGGEINDRDAHLVACCYLIFACDRARDFARAARWCDYVARTAARLSHQFSLSVCRTHYAGLLIARGDWAGAERELDEAIAALEMATPSWAAEGVCRLAELRRRQGRVDEAAALLDRAERPPLRMLAWPEALLARAELALDAGAPARAADLAQRYLRRLPPDARVDRVAGLDLLVRASVAAGRADTARPAVAELADTATMLGSEAVHGLACLARGTLAVAVGDLEVGRTACEDAVDLLAAAGVPYDEARARLALARALRRMGNGPDSHREAASAATTFRELGAATELAEAERLLAGLPSPRGSAETAGEAGLTRRELDVLRLLAVGRGNDEIAHQLVLSPRTVERHVSNVYRKIGVSGRVARAGAAAYAHRHGLVAAEQGTRLP